MKKFTEFFATLAITLSVSILASSVVFAATKVTAPAKSTLPVGTVFKFISAPQVYYVAENNTAYLVPDEATFFSWFASFAKVKAYDKNIIANPISKTILTVKPGARVIRFGTQPQLYTVGRGARLRWIRNKETLVELFGENWQNYYINLPYNRKNDYTTGLDIAKGTDFNRAAERTGLTPNDDLIARKIIAPTKTYAKAPVVLLTQLKSLTENSTSALQPAFSPAVTTYHLTVPYAEDKITITPTANNSTLKIKVRDNEAVSGLGISLDAPLGSTNVPITVEAPDGDSEKYLLVITRNKASENTFLSSFTENLSGTMFPKFSPSTRNYTVTATGKEEVITVVPKLQSTLSRMIIDGKEYPNGTSFQKALVQGNTNVVQVVIVSESGVADRYTLTIKKPN